MTVKTKKIYEHLLDCVGPEIEPKDAIRIIADDFHTGSILDYDTLLDIGHGKYHEISDACTHLIFVGHYASIVQSGGDWPSPNGYLKKDGNPVKFMVIRYNGGWGEPAEIFLENPTFTEAMLAIDKLIAQSSDTHHVFLEVFKHNGQEKHFGQTFDIYKVDFGS